MEMQSIKDLSREEMYRLLVDFSKRWLAHDGLWFLAAEERLGMDAAIELDTKAWEGFTVLEARRIMRFLDLPEGGGLPALARALGFRLYAVINKDELEWEDSGSLVYRMTNCRVQQARDRKSLPLFPCKSVGIVEYSGFARTIDARIETECISCPPDEKQEGHYCAWRFTLREADPGATNGAKGDT